MLALGQGRAVSPQASGEMVEVLARQKFDEAIPAGLPAGTRVAHKTGNITAIHHDAALVLGERPYVLIVLVRGLEKMDESAALIAAIAREVHASVGSARD